MQQQGAAPLRRSEAGPLARSVPSDARRALVGAAAALVLVALGSGILMSAWAHAVVTAGHLPPTELAAFFDRYLDGGLPEVLLIVVAGPVIEEALARGLLLKWLLTRYHPTFAIGLSAAVFAAVHLNPLQLLPALWLGLIFGVVYARTRSLPLCIFGHGIYNAQYWLVRTVLDLQVPGYAPSPPPGAAGAQPVWWLTLGGVLLAAGLVALWRLLRSSRRVDGHHGRPGDHLNAESARLLRAFRDPPSRSG